jgi:hypothetical protein
VYLKDSKSVRIRKVKYNQANIDTMSYELVNQSTEICRKFSRQSWTKALELARLYGWEPMGTLPPSFFNSYQLNAVWSGTYLTNDGQVVKAEDAYLLAAALEKSLHKIPNINNQIDWTSRFWLSDPYPEWLSPEERAMIEEELEDGLLDIMGTDPSEFFAGDEKRQILEVIRFCRLGSFEIM